MEKDINFGDLFSRTLTLFKKHFWFLAPILFIFMFLPSVVKEVYYVFNPVDTSLFINETTGTIIWPVFTDFFAVSSLISLAIWLLTIFGSVSIIYFFIHGTKAKSIGELLSLASTRYFKVLALLILVGLMLIPLYLAIIIPGIIFSLYWVFSQYFVIDENEKIINSIRRSYHLVKGNWWATFVKLLLLGLIIFGVVVASLIIMVIVFLILQGSSFFLEGLTPVNAMISVIVDNLLYAVLTLFSLIFTVNLYKDMKENYEANNDVKEKA